jgi:selenocysteine lyase/cysteine desulfurase
MNKNLIKTENKKTELEYDGLDSYFNQFRKNLIGKDFEFETAFGLKKLYYADWTASGRLYAPIEEKISREIGPYLANTHTETNLTGKTMTLAYHNAQEIIKKHVGARSTDKILLAGSGMTGAMSKFMRIIGIKVPDKLKDKIKIEKNDRPVVFISHMEHHSNQTIWEESLADVVIIKHKSLGEIDLDDLREKLHKHKNRKYKYASVTACSNVTGIQTPYYEIAEIIHSSGGKCFVDFACSAPYVPVNMHPENPAQKIDAIFISPHKFLGGPGSVGVCVFCDSMYDNQVPDDPGGGTVKWTNPWGGHSYFDEIETREDGGTPPFLQTIKAAYAIMLKDKMTSEKLMEREHYIRNLVFEHFDKIPNLRLLANDFRDRMCVFSFYIDELHYNLAVRILNDRYGIQVRGGCSCAGTYGHIIFDIDQDYSCQITSKIDEGDNSEKVGWIRMSFHPVGSNQEILHCLNSVKELAENFHDWGNDYSYDKHSDSFVHTLDSGLETKISTGWFSDV